MRTTLCAVIICGFTAAGVVAAPTPTPTPLDQKAAIEESSKPPPADQQAALAFARKKGTAAASDSAKIQPASSPAAAGSPPARPASYVPVDPSKVPILGKPGPGTKAKEEPTIDSWLEHNIELRSSFYDAKQVDSPAKISWTKNMNEAAFYTVDAAIVGTMFSKNPRSLGTIFGQDFSADVTPIFEAHISTQGNTSTKHNSQDSLLYALPVNLRYTSAISADQSADYYKKMMEGPTADVAGSPYQSKLIEGGDFIVNPAYRMDQDHKVDAFEGGFYWKPGTSPLLHINAGKPLIPNFLYFRSDPTIGFEIGSYESTTNLANNIPRNYYRGFFRIHGALRIGDDYQPAFTLAADYTLRDELSSPSTAYNYSEISAIYNVDRDRPAEAVDAGGKPKVDPTGKQTFIMVPGHLKVGATWKHGKDVPLFMNADTFTAWLGVQF